MSALPVNNYACGHTACSPFQSARAGLAQPALGLASPQLPMAPKADVYFGKQEPPAKAKKSQVKAQTKVPLLNWPFVALIQTYRWLTRKSPLAGAAQASISKCPCCTVLGQKHSCSDAGLKAFETYQLPWAMAYTVGRVFTCNPFTMGTPLGGMFKTPLSLAEFGQKWKETCKGKPLASFGQLQDYLDYGAGFGKAVLSSLTPGAKPWTPPKEKPSLPKCEALLDLNPQHWHTYGILSLMAKPRNYQNKPMTAYVEPTS